MGDIPQLKALVYNVCMVRTSFITHNQKFCTLGAPKEKYMSPQNDGPIDLACHGSNLNMQISSGTKYDPPTSHEQSSITKTVSFNDVLLVVAGTYGSPYENPARIRLKANPGLVGKHHTNPMLRCPQCRPSTPK
ncbi:uncharacterized protein TNCV_4066711 [Trichonephila clavipes]|uniref:Uncharacterized protein n=1 Tax=Trichonephila clavipes TaxID=2585209 RepID=A0A8X7BG55_TRICX|nr:uncharacterized protein TNCV_4066711 [Trichonephila clavipes]